MLTDRHLASCHHAPADYTSQHQNPLRNVGLYVNEGDTEAFYPEENPFAPGTFITRQASGGHRGRRAGQHARRSAGGWGGLLFIQCACRFARSASHLRTGTMSFLASKGKWPPTRNEVQFVPCSCRCAPTWCGCAAAPRKSCGMQRRSRWVGGWVGGWVGLHKARDGLAR